MTRAKVVARAVELGASLVIDLGGGWPEVRIEAPHGHTWNDGQDPIHEIIVAGYRGEPAASLYGEAFGRMKIGVMPCPFGAECEWCRSEVVA